MSIPERPLRVLIVSDFYPPLIGGATRSAQLLAHGLARRGHRVVVATTWQPGTVAAEDDGDVAVRRLRGLTMRLPALSGNPYRRIAPPFPDPELVWRLRRLLRRERPDVVHASGWLAYSCAAALAGSDVPLVLAGRDYGHVCANGTLLQHDRSACTGPRLRKCLACAAGHYGPAKGTVAVLGVLGGRRLLRRRVAAVQSVSRHVREVLRAHLLRAPIEAVIPDFRAANGARPDDRVLARLPRESFILFVGPLRQIKGVRVLLAAYERLADPPPLVVLGTRAPDMPAAFPPGVTVEYDVSHATVMAAWERALFGVAPSLIAEPLGNVVHEAMSRGRAVIGTRPGGHEEMIEDGVDGLLVGRGDVEGLAAAMRRLAGDGDLRRRLERRAPERAERFTEEVQLPRLEELLHRAARGAEATA
ncbi:MAG TPA: glycosyltransferase family 4 protein [Gaiellaceae bacterium]|jgi:glycosyltransferase involved in cell wall biosynthesis